MRPASYSMNGQLVNVILKIMEELHSGEAGRGRNLPHNWKEHVHAYILEMTPTVVTKGKAVARAHRARPLKVGELREVELSVQRHEVK